MSSTTARVEVYTWKERGYKPFVAFGDWMVAALNWEPIFDADKLGEIERHKETDEVFVLWKGRGALFVSNGEGIELIDMEPGAIYNIPQGTWHNLVSTRDASWIIVETRGTDIHDTEIRQMTTQELEQLHQSLPDWVEG